MYNLNDIAKEVGVSKTVVSIYLNDPDTKRVSPATKAQIDEVVRRLNYNVNPIARSLSTRKSYIIGVLIPVDFPPSFSFFNNELLAGLQSVLLRRGYSLLLPPTGGGHPSEMVRNQLSRSRGYDGLVLCGTRNCSKKDMEENINECIKAGVKFVVLNMPDLGHMINQVYFKNDPGANAIRHLFDLRHRRILLIAGNTVAADSEEEVLMYKYWHEKYGIPVDEELIVYGGYECGQAKAAFLNVLKKKLSFTAVYCITATMALGVYEACKEANLRIPQDISIITRYDFSFTRFLDPPLSTIRVPIFEAGSKGAEILLNNIERGEVPKKVELNTEILHRLSTKVLE